MTDTTSTTRSELLAMLQRGPTTVPALMEWAIDHGGAMALSECDLLIDEGIVAGARITDYGPPVRRNTYVYLTPLGRAAARNQPEGVETLAKGVVG